MTTIFGTASTSIALTQGMDIADDGPAPVSSNAFVFFAGFDGTDKRINFPGSVNDKI